MNTLRAFFAVPLPEPAIGRVRKIQQDLKHAAGDTVRWARPEQLHITLAFMAALPQDQVPRLVDRIPPELAAFDCTLGGPEYFPSTKRKRVIALPVLNPETLDTLAAAIRSAMADCELEVEDRPFNGHLTIGRIRRGENPGRLETETKPIVFPVHHVELVKSVLRPEGPEYTVLHTCALHQGELK